MRAPAATSLSLLQMAQLYACKIDLRSVDLKSGNLPSSATFEAVGAVKFRKAVATDMTHHPSGYESFKEGRSRKERSVVVVNVTHLTSWLSTLSLRKPSPLAISPLPWRHLQ